MEQNLKKWFITYTLTDYDRANKPRSVIVEATNRPKAVSQLKQVIPYQHYKACTILDCVKIYNG